MKNLKILGGLSVLMVLGIFQAVNMAPNPGTMTTNANCFIDSAIEVIFHLKPLRDVFSKYQDQLKKDSVSIKIINALQELEVVQTANNKFEDLRKSLAEDKLFSSIKGTEQKPAPEFLESVVNSLVKDFKTVDGNIIENTLQVFNLLFFGENTVQEVVDRDFSSLSNPPVITCFVISRLDERGQKITNPYTFPLNGLSISGKKYDLYGIICHSGASLPRGLALAGHYWAYAKWFRDGKWYYYNNAPDMYTPAWKPIERQVHGKAVADAVADETFGVFAQKQYNNVLVSQSGRNPEYVIDISQNDMENIANQKVEKGFPEILFYQRSDWKPEAKKIEEPIPKPEEKKTAAPAVKPEEKELRKNLREEEGRLQANLTSLAQAKKENLTEAESKSLESLKTDIADSNATIESIQKALDVLAAKKPKPEGTDGLQSALVTLKNKLIALVQMLK